MIRCNGISAFHTALACCEAASLSPLCWQYHGVPPPLSASAPWHPCPFWAVGSHQGLGLGPQGGRSPLSHLLCSLASFVSPRKARKQQGEQSRKRTHTHVHRGAEMSRTPTPSVSACGQIAAKAAGGACRGARTWSAIVTLEV